MFTEFPPALERLGRVLDGMSFGIEVASPQCAVDGMNYYTLFAATLVALLLSVLVLTAKPLYAVVTKGRVIGFRAATRKVLVSAAGASAFRDAFVVVLVLHPSISGKAMQFFRCRTIDEVPYLMADYSIKCYDRSWYLFLPVIIIVITFFSLGTPLAIAYLLYARRDKLYDDTGKAIPQPLGILYAIYHPKAYWYESVQMIFKLALWSALVFFEVKSEMQIATALVVNVLQLCVHIEIKPMGGVDAKLLNVMQACTLVLTTQVQQHANESS